MIVDRVGEFPGICFGNCLLFYFHLFINVNHFHGHELRGNYCVRIHVDWNRNLN